MQGANLAERGEIVGVVEKRKAKGCQLLVKGGNKGKRKARGAEVGEPQ